MLIHTLFYNPITIYVFGHELTHALSTWLCGGEVKGFKVSSKGGSTSVTKSNLFISLAPYLFPIYTIVATAAYFGVTLAMRRFTEIVYHILYMKYYIFAVGFTWAFHMVLTADIARRRQSDFAALGHFLSIVVIYIANVNVLMVILNAIFDEVQMEVFWTDAAYITRDVYAAVFSQLFR